MMTILLVDDEEKNLKLLEAILRPHNYGLMNAADGETALNILQKKEVDMVLLDIMMPDISGLEVLKKIRQDERLKTLPVIVITALDDKEDKIKGLKLGADDYISKPFDKDELLARVNTQLKLSYLRRQLVEKEKFEYLLNQIEDGIIVFNKDLKITRCNEVAKNHLMMPVPDENFNFIQHIRNKFKVHFAGDLSLTMCKLPVFFDLEREATDAFKTLILEGRTSIIRNIASGEIADILMIVRDVTSVRIDELMRQDFLSIMSHKLRTPICEIQGSLFLLKRRKTEGTLSEKQKEYINMADKQCKKLTELVDRLLKFTELFRASMGLDKEKLMLADYIPQVLEQAMRPFQDKKVEKEIIFDNREECIMTNKYYFAVILNELVNNALKFNDKDTAKITIRIKRDSGKISISISDNGPGIPAEEQKNIFKKFCQLERYFTGNVPGLGLGLAIAAKFAKASDGEIKITSVVGEGAEVAIMLPAA